MDSLFNIQKYNSNKIIACININSVKNKFDMLTNSAKA